jgi:hypothetical protein
VLGGSSVGRNGQNVAVWRERHHVAELLQMRNIASGLPIELDQSPIR